MKKHLSKVFAGIITFVVFIICWVSIGTVSVWFAGFVAHGFVGVVKSFKKTKISEEYRSKFMNECAQGDQTKFNYCTCAFDEMKAHFSMEEVLNKTRNADGTPTEKTLKIIEICVKYMP